MLRIISACIFLSLFTNTLAAQQSFPSFPPKDVTAAMDRDQMLFQLGVKLPALPSKLKDPHAPQHAVPADSTKPEANWKDAEGHIITRSGWELWNNYGDHAGGFFPGKDSQLVGRYTPINLLKNKNGKIISTPQKCWNGRRAEILKDAQEFLYGIFPPDSILFAVKYFKTEKQ